MKKYLTSSQIGVTLLEIMLVLAIAAMVIVMSVRYYQAASTSNQVNATMQLIQGITAAADQISQSNGTYAAASAAAINSLAGSSALYLPWGGTATIAASVACYTVTMTNAPLATCQGVYQKMKGNNHYGFTTCTSSSGIVYSYSP